MARPLRINLADGWYHVMGRAIERRALFRDDRDRSHFLDLVAALPEQFCVRVHAYVLMQTHAHLQVETPDANLSEAMQWMNQSYATWFNRRHRRLGPLFAGRFKAILTEAGDWAAQVNRYLHLNPVRTAEQGLDKAAQQRQRLGLSGPPSPEVVQRRMQTLRAYRWSSYRAYVGLATTPRWLTCEVVLRGLGKGTRAEQQQRYRAWVETLLREGLEESPWERAAAGLLLGSAEFVRRMKRTLQGEWREQPEARVLRDAVGWDQIRAAVEEVHGGRWEEFVNRHGDWGRDVGWYLGRKWGRLKLRELGAQAGGVDYATVSVAVKRMAQRLEKDRQLGSAVRRAEQLLNVKT